MATKIPQDVTREDKLFGPLTLRQFLAILLGSGIVFIIYQGYAKQYLYFIEFLALSLIFGGFTLAWTFFKINGRPFPVFAANLLHYVSTPKYWSWEKEDRALHTPIKVSAEDIKSTRTEVEERKSGKIVKMQIEQLANVLDTGGTINSDHDAVVVSQMTDALAVPGPKPSLELTDVEDVLAEVD